MRIVITGGTGRLGKYLTREMKNYHEVTVFDKKESKEKGIHYLNGDVQDINDCKKAFKNCDAIIHLAGIPDTWNDSPEVVFKVNTLGTFNVFQSACDLGIKKVVYAGSETTYGFHFRLKKDLLPVYLPLDENHPLKPADAYGLSKKVGEETALSFSRRYGINSVVVRICWMWFPEDIKEYKKAIEDPSSWMGLWSYVDYRDAIQAFRLATEVDCKKRFEIFLIAADDNGTNVESKELINRYCSEKVELTMAFEGRQSLLDCTKAKNILGYRPKYTWRDLIR